MRGGALRPLLPMGYKVAILQNQGLRNFMKITDNQNAKYRLWAENPIVVPAPPPTRLPHFKSRRFSSHAEMNEWKQSLLKELAARAPVQ
jgi:hypothetical protein